MARLDDQDVLKAASRALDELTRRDRDTLEQAILDNKPIEEIARASMIAIERAAFWIDGARTQFREKLRAQLDKLGIPEPSPTEVLDLLAAVLRLARTRRTTRHPDDPQVMRAANAALNQLTNRDQELLELVLVEQATPDTIATTKGVSREQAKIWIREAWSKFAERLSHHLERVGVSKEEVHELLAISDQIGANAYRLRMTTLESAAPATPTATTGHITCPTCGVRFKDPTGQLEAYAKLAAEKRIGLMIGCTSCRLLWVPTLT